MATTTQAPKDLADDKRASGGAGAVPAASSSSSLFTVGRWLAVVVVAFAAGVATGGSSPSVVMQDAIVQWQSLSSRALVALFDSPTTIADDTPESVDCQDAHQYLTEVMPVKGFHVLCIETTANDTLMVTAFKDGMHSNASAEVTADAQSFKLTVEQQLLGMEAEPASELAAKYKQPAAYFTPDGVRLDSSRALRNRIVFLFEGGQFIWPGVKIGHKTLIRDVFGRGDVELETLSMTPLVFGVEEFLRDDEIDIILELSLDHLAPSGVSLLDGHENRPATDWRTSSTYWLPSSRHRVVQNIDRRTADLTKIPISHQEDVQVLRYEKTQKYDQHLDYFDATKHRNSPSVLKSIEFGFKNRMVTVFWYMSDVARGGHTNFPRAGGLEPPHTNVGCFQGLKVAPKKRKVVVFYSMLPSGEGDPMSLHGGCPVEEGVKFSGNKWVWNKPRR